MNNGLCTERALLGQFAQSSYTTLGDPYAKKGFVLDRYKNKQFQTMPAKGGRCKEALFGRAFPWLSDGDKYVDKCMYLKTQPPDARKRGFMSSDAHRRDEFMNHIRTEQWRWALGREQDIKKFHPISTEDKYTKPKGEALPPIAPLGERDESFHTPQFLYDIGKGSNVTAFSQKLPRENWYLATRDTSKPRNLGDWQPMSYEVGNEMVQQADLHKPTYASTPIIQSTFYRAGSVKANAGWSALR